MYWQDIILFFFLLFTLLLAWTALTNIFFRVPYVPSKRKVIEVLKKELKFKKGDTFYDLGCGDGRILFNIEKKQKITAIGYEISFLIYLFALIRRFFSRSKAKIYLRNFLHADLKDADVIFCYLGPEVLQKLVKKIKKECRKGTRIVSNTFKANDLKPFKVIKKDAKKGIPSIYFYKI